MNRETKFQIGDKLRIRSWDDMRKEFGGSAFRINCPYGVAFVGEMKPFCGQIVIVDRIDYQGYDRYFFSNESEYCADAPLGDWIFTDAMLEYAEIDVEIDPISACDVDKILFS